MAKDLYGNKGAPFMDESIKATRKLLKDPYAGRAQNMAATHAGRGGGMAAKDRSRNQDPEGKPIKVGTGDIPVNSWMRGGGKGGEGYDCFMRTPTGKNRGGREKTPQDE
jgi:hypothetical protein